MDPTELSKDKKSKSQKSQDKKSRRKSKKDVENQTPEAVPEEPKKSKKRSRSESTSKAEKKAKKSKREEKPVKKETPVTQEPEPVAQPVTKTKSSKNNVKNESNRFLSDDAAAIKKFRDTHRIAVYGDVDNFTYFSTFAEGNFPSDILKCTKTFGTPTPIQAQTWPILLSNRDVIGIAETGSGKTLSFGLPGLCHVKKLKSQGVQQPTMLVVAPTRELAQQSHEVLANAGKLCTPPINSVSIYGGVPKHAQVLALKKKSVDVIVACPGRLLDLANDGSCDLSQVEYMVLDEADRMLDMGFERDIRAIFGMVKKNRQTVMFSATWPKSVQLLASEFLVKPIRVVVGSEDLTANSRVEQIVEVIDMDARDARLFELLKSYHKKGEKIIIFVLYKKEASRLETLLNKRGFSSTAIHGDKSSPARAEALENFKSGRIALLIATDVAARGLDIPKVEYVINYSFPLTVEDYVHRIGRTGRAGATGISHTFFHKHDKSNSGELIAVLRAAKANIPEDLLAFGTTTKKKEPKLGKIDVNFEAQRITFDDSDDDL